MSENTEITQLIDQVTAIVGSAHTLVDTAKIQPYCKGYRFGSGGALAVVRPGSLLDIWKVLNACHKADVAMIMQAANTGLTGGSTPSGDDYDRPLVIINTMRIDHIHLINNATQIVGLAGSTLFGLEELLAKHDREPHSVIGSSSVGASIVGGICNNSGGSLIHRGPAYTELSLFAHIDANGELSLVNHLGIELGDTPEDILTNLEQKNYTEADIQFPEGKLASDNGFQDRLRDVDAATASRYNADERRLFEASGCAGKLAVFAVRLDTFPKAQQERVFYIGVNSPELMTRIRRDMLSSFTHLPISGDFYDRECYDVAKKYGKDTFLVIDKLGSKYIPKLFALKRAVDRMTDRLLFLPDKFSDRFMQFLSYCWPNHLPKRMDEFRDRYKLHWIVEANNEGIEEAQHYLDNLFNNADGVDSKEGGFFVCSEKEAKQAALHRYVIAGAVSRYNIIYAKDNGPMMTFDVALRRNEQDWLQPLPQHVEEQVKDKFDYGHFFCHVMHHNYVMKKGVDPKTIKPQILESYAERGAAYPSEHNVGHEYAANET